MLASITCKTYGEIVGRVQHAVEYKKIKLSLTLDADYAAFCLSVFEYIPHWAIHEYKHS